MFLPVRFCRVLWSLIFIWEQQSTKHLIRIQGREKATAIYKLNRFIHALLCKGRQPEVAEAHQHREDTLEASSFGRHSCTHKVETGSPPTSCLSQIALSHFGRHLGRSTLTQLVHTAYPWNAGCIYSTPYPCLGAYCCLCVHVLILCVCRSLS